MKTILVLSILFSSIALPALGALTVEDIEKIDVKIKASEEGTKKHIDLQIKSVTGNINIQMESVDNRLWLVTTLIVGLIAPIVLAVSIPQILMALRSRRDESLEKQIETLTQEIETLKQQQIVRP